jgi:hypothetical protein
VFVVNNERTDRYTLKNGRYVLVKAAKEAEHHEPELTLLLDTQPRAR